LKHSQILGIIAALCVIGSCFLPWSIIIERNIIIKGIEARGTDFGKPGLFNIIISVLMILLFVLNKLWAKRINLFLGAINFAWSIRNYIIVTTCFLGECPQKQMGLFLLVIFCTLTMVMTFLPKIEFNED